MQEIYDYMEKFAPLAWQESYDNAGLQWGSMKKEIKKIMLSLDLTQTVAEEAVKEDYDLILTHHPILFRSIKSLDFDTRIGRMMKTLIEKDIAVLSWHTNLDRARGGVNDILAERLEVKVLGDLMEEEDRPGMGRYGEIEEIDGTKWLKIVKEGLNVPYLICYGNPKKKIRRVGLLGGSGADGIEKAIMLGLDAYLTADIKYHDTEEALAQGLLLIDAGHYYTEFPMMEKLVEILGEQFPQVTVKVKKRDFQGQAI